MVSTPVSGWSGPGTSPGRGNCAVYLDKTVFFESASLHLGERGNPGE